MEDIAGFLGSHPPFDAVDTGELARIAAVAVGAGDEPA